MLLLGGFAPVACSDSSGPQFGSDGPQSGWMAASAGDVDGDGSVDLLVHTPFEPVSRSNYGLTRVISCKTRACLLTLSNESSSFVSDSVGSPAGDVNGDGRSDLLCDRGGRRVVIDAASRRELFGLENEGYELSAPIGDVDGDGGGDLLVRGHPRAPRPTGFFSRPPWTYYLSVVSGKKGSVVWSLEGREVNDGSFFRSFGNHGCACGDVDGDGVPDVAIDTETARVRVLSGRDGAIVRELDVGCDDHGGQIAAVGDLDGDGAFELLVRADYGAPLRIVSCRTGDVLRTINVDPNVYSYFLTAMSPGDVDGDRVPDVACGWFNWIRVYSGSDGHEIARFDGHWLGTGSLDLDGDGFHDLLVTRNVWGDAAREFGDDVWRAGRVEVLSGRDRSILFELDGDDLTPAVHR